MQPVVSIIDAVDQVKSIILAQTSLNEDAARGKATRAVAYERALRRHKDTLPGQHYDWEYVTRLIGAKELTRICGF
ncbi:MAG TPA: hypothetical protein VMQ44_00660 [Candidatus Saccharimonadales bacterium]|nr:hypothetical protein [Candidatus Saccharimonadales bacterium]